MNLQLILSKPVPFNKSPILEMFVSGDIVTISVPQVVPPVIGVWAYDAEANIIVNIKVVI